MQSLVPFLLFAVVASITRTWLKLSGSASS